MRSYASAARSSGNGSFIDRTPVSTLKAIVSSESIDVPDGQPTIDRRPEISEGVGTSRGRPRPGGRQASR
jgi:hypothetical protein